jgi:lipocalin-like protein
VTQLVMAIALLLGAKSSGLPPQTAESLIGSWKLVTVSAKTADGEAVDHPMGLNPIGVHTYTSDGRMSSIISFGGRKPLSTSDRFAAPLEEKAEAFVTFFAYAGRYSVKAGKVTHHVEIASVQNWANTDLIRDIQIERDRITYRVPAQPLNGVMRTTELVFDRMK